MNEQHSAKGNEEGKEKEREGGSLWGDAGVKRGQGSKRRRRLRGKDDDFYKGGHKTEKRE